MKLLVNLIVVSFVILAIGLGIPDAHAKRFGGGRSFGSKPSYTSPFRRSATPRQTYAQQQSAAKNQSLRESFSRRGGLMGMLGGLALGGLLGSLLFGGAFENINLFDILVFAGIAFLLYKLFAARVQSGSDYRSAARDYGPSGSFDTRRNFDPGQAGHRRAFDTDLLFKNGRTHPAPQNVGNQDADFEDLTPPNGFEERAFLEGAKNAYRKLQAAWDQGDLSEIRALTTDPVFAEIKEQIGQRDSDNRTAVLKLDAELLDVREVNRQTEATVLFDSILRESADERPVQIREIWHFIRPTRSSRPTWFLDGIQQLED